MTKSKKIGVALLIGSIALLPIVLSGYAITSFVLQQSAVADSGAQTGLAASDLRSTTAQIIRVVFGLLGIVGVLVFLVGLPLAIYFLVRKDVSDAELIASLQQNEKYKSLTPEQISYITRWSWGAFFNGFVWALGNKLYGWALLTFIPFYNIYVWIKLSASGRQMAWEKGWKDFGEFKQRQITMAWIILGLFVAYILLNVFVYNS